MHDRFAIDGKLTPPERRVGMLVIGAGPAGTAAALEAARRGAQVLLVDENPVPIGLMGIDVPLHYGQRMTGAVQNTGAMLERVLASNPALEAAYEAGVELALGTCAWGLYTPAPGLAALPEAMVGLADAERAWMVGFDALVLATGGRDLALGFPGWELPGVMGANALDALLTRYEAFAGRRVLVLGSGELALRTALTVIERGLAVAGVVEARDAVQGDPTLAARLAVLGVPLHVGTTIVSVEGGLDGVEAVWLRGSGGAPFAVACDTVCLAVGAVPAIELLQAAGGRVAGDPARGGHVPVLAGRRSSLPGVFIAGDAGGLTPSADAAAAEGRAAALAALGIEGPADPAAPSPTFDHHAYRRDWMRALSEVADADTVVCQCEAVTRADLLGVQPPRYLGDRSAAMAARSLATLLADGPVDQDQIKRLTRAGMGVCQGRRCREQVALLLELAADPAAPPPLAGWRAPVRPVPLALLAEPDERADMAAGWDVWMGIPEQWVPHHRIGTDRDPSLAPADAAEPA